MQAGDIIKTRQLVFTEIPPGQADEAALLLEGLPHLVVVEKLNPRTLLVRYEIPNYTLEKVERALAAEGFHLDNSILSKIRRALIYYCESIQCENLAPPPLERVSKEIFAEAWQNHPHGDRDDTPEEWRSYR
ncbi:hypothetical protein [Thiobacter aerophilum]|uniref:Cation transporter n=1 Tax=Thiobacter aerophilum TaxID=3121275 RepID=A0ABV0EGD5_9BURK